MSEEQTLEIETLSSPEEPPAPQDEIRLLAYQFWEERGCPNDSPEEDWLRAEEEIARRAAPPLTLSAAV